METKEVNELIPEEPRLTFFEKVKFWFSNVFGAIGNFFKKLFSKEKEIDHFIDRETNDETNSTNQPTQQPQKETVEHDHQKDNKKEIAPPKAQPMLLSAEIAKEQDSIIDETPQSNKNDIIIQQDEIEHINDIQNETLPPAIAEENPISILSKTKMLESKIDEMIENCTKTHQDSVEGFIFGENEIVLSTAVYEAGSEEYTVTVDVYLNKEPLFIERGTPIDTFNSEIEQKGKFPSTWDALSHIESQIGSQELVPMLLAQATEKHKQLTETHQPIANENTTPVQEEQLVKEMTPKEMLLSKIQQADARATNLIMDDKNVVIQFEMEDETTVIAIVQQTGEIELKQSDTKMESFNLEEFNKKATNVVSQDIGFVETANALSKIITENKETINKIYTSAEEVERREKKMFAQAEITKITDIEQLKDTILTYLNDANRNKIVYDAADKALYIKLPTQDRDDGTLEMGRNFKIDLVTMKPYIETEIMQLGGRGGYETKTVEADVNAMESKYIAIYDLVKGNKDFFHKDLSIGKHSPQNRNHGKNNYADEVLNYEEDGRDRQHSKDHNRKNYKEQRREKRGMVNHDAPKPKPKKKFVPNYEDEDHDL